MLRGKKFTPGRILAHVKWRFARLVFVKMFPFWQRLGFHITQVRGSSPIPDTRTLNEDVWRRRSELIGIEMNEERQLALLADFVDRFKTEYDRLPHHRDQISKPYEYYIHNDLFGPVDGEILYCMIRHFKPRTILEIGSGNSTFLAARTTLVSSKDGGHGCELVAIDPYASDTLKAGFPGLSKLVPRKVQEVSLSEFSKLAQNDILFIDTSHMLRIGSDVQYEYLEVLPRLNKGVIIHSHDIYLPAEYPKTLLNERKFFNEQYLLQAFLSFNDSFEILWAGWYMHLRHTDKLASAFNSYRRDRPWPLRGSFWFRKTK